MIHLWNTSAVVEELSRGAPSERSRLHYLIAASLIAAITPYLSYMFDQARHLEWLVAYEAVLVAAVVVIGTRRCYAANGGDASADFLGRFVCLSVPVGLKVTVGAWIAYVACLRLFDFVLENATMSSDSAATASAYWTGRVLEFLPFATAVGSIVVYYARMEVHFSRVRIAGMTD
jgi:hypothetical protein